MHCRRVIDAVPEEADNVPHFFQRQNDPFLLIADEPTGNLDERATRGVFQLLRDINASGTAVLMATHDLELVRRAEYRTLELNAGEIVFDSAEVPPSLMAETA